MVEKFRRASTRGEYGTKVIKHNFDEDFVFPWTHITAHQIEKSVYWSYYVWMASVSVRKIQTHMQEEHGKELPTAVRFCIVLELLCTNQT